MAKKKQELGLEEIPVDYWMNDEPWGNEEDEGKDSKVEFRVHGKFLRLAQELLGDPQSPFFGLFKTPSDLYRHIYIKGILALGSMYNETKGKAVSMRVREAAVARDARDRSLRARVVEAVEPAIKAIQEDITAGDINSAAKFLDDFLLEVNKLEDKEIIGVYVRGLLTHHAFQLLRGNKELGENSEILWEMEKEYGK